MNKLLIEKIQQELEIRWNKTNKNSYYGFKADILPYLRTQILDLEDKLDFRRLEIWLKEEII